MSEKPIVGDAWTETHFVAWLERTVRADDRERVEPGMRTYVEEHPEVITEMGWSWPEVRGVAEREGFIKPFGKAS